MAEEFRYHMDPDKLVFIANSAALSADLDKLGDRSWLPSEIAEMAQGKEWGQGIDTAAAAAAIRSMTLGEEGLAIECDPQGFQDVVTGYLVSNTVSWTTTEGATFTPAPPSVEQSTKIVLFIVYCAARRGVDRMFDPLPTPWWSMVLEPQGELPSWVQFPEHLQRQRTALRAQIKKAPDLFTSATAAEVEEREKLMVQYLRENKEVQAVEVEMHMTPEESAVHRLLVERFSQFGYPLQVELTPGEILDGCGLPETPDNYRRIREAIHRLVTEPRLRAYRHAIDADKAPKRAWGKDPKKPRKEPKATFVNIGPLWDITNVYAEGRERVTMYKVRPMGELFHQVNELHQGRPAYYRWELLQLMPKLSQDLGSLSDAAQAEKLLTAIRNNIYPKGKWAQAAPGVIDPDGWLVFDYKDTARVLQLPTMGKPPTRAPRDEREERIRERIRALVADGRDDKFIADHLSEYLGEAITRAEAKKQRERMVGGSLAPRAPTEPRKLRPKLEKLLKALQGTHPEFLLGNL